MCLARYKWSCWRSWRAELEARFHRLRSFHANVGLWRRGTCAPRWLSLMCPVILDARLRFPDPGRADEEGLVAIGGDLSVSRLLLAYRSGIFPWTAAPVTWWSPDPRAILELNRLHVPRSLARVIRRGVFEITRDRAFRQVMEGCAEPAVGRGSTWITSAFLEAYVRLHEEGHAHSLECWEDGRLAGGIYGVAVGGLFAGESMFHRASDASKVALVQLVEHLRRQGFVLCDIQMLTPVTAQLGGVNITRQEYLRRLASAIEQPCVF
jgi:leucyl/phenylalanyl-tRNA---protein transferase